MPYNRINAIVGGKEKAVTSVDVYKEICRLHLEGVTSQWAATKQLGFSHNTVKKYWEGNAVPLDRKEYSRNAAVITTDVVQFISACLEHIGLALSLLEHGKTYRQITAMMGISKSTLIRARNQWGFVPLVFICYKIP